jgi:tripartite-type tricarboxylate transporter receptor subunit TctC
MGRNIGQSIVIDNKPGGSGLIGVRAMTAQGYDGGHTLCYVTSGHVTLNAMTPQFDLLKETRLVTMASSSPLVFVVHADSPYRTLQDVVQAMRASPGKITYGWPARAPLHTWPLFTSKTRCPASAHSMCPTRGRSSRPTPFWASKSTSRSACWGHC